MKLLCISEKSMIDGFHQRYGIRSLELGSREIGTIAEPERYIVALTGLSLSKCMKFGDILFWVPRDSLTLHVQYISIPEHAHYLYIFMNASIRS